MTAVALAAGLALAWTVAFPAWPDDWDGLGFLASIRRFDLATFSPHPPGYPVYVALLKVAALVARTPIGAARIVGVGSGVVAFAGLLVALRGPAGRLGRDAFAAAVACASPLVFHAFSGVGSEAPALACAAVAAAGLRGGGAAASSRVRALLVGLGVGLGLGVRLSWAPFYLAFLVVAPALLRTRALVAALLACVSWSAALVGSTGARELLLLARTHLAGHMTRWGGTVVTEPTRARYLVRDVLVDGLGVDRDVLGAATLCLLLVVALFAWRAWRSSTSDPERSAALARAAVFVVPYLFWVAIGQNLRQQPRHVLPLVALAAFAVARAALAARPARGATVMFVVLALLLVARTAFDARGRAVIPPPGVQLLAYLREHEASAPFATTAVFAGASGRFLEESEWRTHLHPAATLGDAVLALGHMDRLPDRLLVTSELAGTEDRGAPVTNIATFCRPERVDRRLPCLDLYAVDVNAALVR